jgi:hypothetical protein
MFINDVTEITNLQGINEFCNYEMRRAQRVSIENTRDVIFEWPLSVFHFSYCV